MNNQKYPVITSSDAEIAAALEEASIPTLLMSMIHISGDASLLDGPIRPGTPMLNEIQGFMSEEDKAQVRRQALELIRSWRDGGRALPPPPDEQTIRRMMAFIVGEQEFPEEYLPMMLEELRLSGDDQRHVAIDSQAVADWSAKRTGKPLHVVVVGAGMSGVLAAIRLKQAGIDFTMLEKNAAVGGTWYENHYPGCRVDIANHFYSYSFEHDYQWSQFFAERDELYSYFRSLVEKYDILPHIRFESECESASFDEGEELWNISYRCGDQLRHIDANVLVTASGQLNRPKTPEVPGRERFSGAQMHSAEWDDSVPLAGKKVAVIGTGASAFQLVPELAKMGCRLTVFQRSAPWMMANENYHKSVGPGKQWCLSNLPHYQDWYRFLIFWPGSDGAYPMLMIDPQWDDGGLSINEANRGFRDYLVDYIKSEVQDPELLAKVIPDYPPMGKRLLQDNGSWFAALQRDNVELVNSANGIREITEHGLIDSDGQTHDFDVLIWATGFHADRLLMPMRIEGRGGQSLQELWGDEPKAYLGITVPEFPNLFCLYGPNTNLAHAGSIIFHSECQVRYLMSALKLMLEKQLSTIECKQQAFDGYEQRLSEQLAKVIWSYPKMNNWYKNKHGRVVNTSPWRLVDYWSWTRQMAPEDFELKNA